MIVNTPLLDYPQTGDSNEPINSHIVLLNDARLVSVEETKNEGRRVENLTIPLPGRMRLWPTTFQSPPINLNCSWVPIMHVLLPLFCVQATSTYHGPVSLLSTSSSSSSLNDTSYVLLVHPYPPSTTYDPSCLQLTSNTPGNPETRSITPSYRNILLLSNMCGH